MRQGGRRRRAPRRPACRARPAQREDQLQGPRAFAGENSGLAGGRQEGSREPFGLDPPPRQRGPAGDGARRRAGRAGRRGDPARRQARKAGDLMARTPTTSEEELPAYPIRAYQLIPDPNQPSVVALAIETDQGHSLFLATRQILEDLGKDLLERSAKMPLKPPSN